MQALVIHDLVSEMSLGGHDPGLSSPRPRRCPPVVVDTTPGRRYARRFLLGHRYRPVCVDLSNLTLHGLSRSMRVGRHGDRPPDDQVIRSLLNSFSWGHDTLLVAKRGAGRPNSWRDEQ